MNPKNSKYSTVLTAFHLVEPSDSLKKKNTQATISVNSASTKINLNMNSFPLVLLRRRGPVLPTTRLIHR